MAKKFDPHKYAHDHIRRKSWFALDSPAFWEAWDGFIENRVALKCPLTEAAIKIILKKLNRWGAGKAVESLEQSTERSWRGVFLVVRDPSGPQAGLRYDRPMSPKDGVNYD